MKVKEKKSISVKRPRTLVRRDNSFVRKRGEAPRSPREAKETYGTAQYKSWRESVFLRDSFTCQMCGKKGDLEAHHIRPKSIYPELTLEKTNGITLCKVCHQDIVTRREANFCYIFTRVVNLNTRREEMQAEVRRNARI